MTLKVKEGVVFKEFNVYTIRMLSAAQVASNLLGKDVVVTSANDGTHGKNSLHYVNKALDFRTRDYTQDERDRFKSYMENQLSTSYDIILETNPLHLHVEFNPR